MLFRGTQDGRVLAYDFKTGKRMWETTIADVRSWASWCRPPRLRGTACVFIGNAGGDFKGGKGRMYALDAKTGKIVWAFFLVPNAEGEATRGPLGALPLDSATWNNAPGIANGRKLCWGQELGGAIGGGVITLDTADWVRKKLLWRLAGFFFTHTPGPTKIR